MQQRLFPCIVSLAMGLSLTGFGVQARAQTGAAKPAPLAAAQALYDEATKAMDAKDYATACPKLEDVVKLAPQGVGARLTLAECYEAAGKLASAAATFARADAMAGEAKQLDRQKEAHTRAEELKPKVARLTIAVTERTRSLAQLKVLRDGEPVAPDEWGVAIPVDKGRHAVMVTVAGKQIWTKAVEVTADGVIETVIVDALVETPATPVAPPPPPLPEDKARPSVPLVIGGAALGVVLLATGIGLGVAAQSKGADADLLLQKVYASGSPCPSSPKAGTCLALLSDRQGHDGLHNAFVGLVVTGVLVGAATAGYALWPRAKHERPMSLRAVPLVGPGVGGALVSGTF